MSRRGWVLFVAVGVIWGIPFLLIKVADTGVSVAVLVFTRVFIGSMLLLPLAVRRGQLRALLPRWRWLVALSVVEIILPWLLLSAAERRLSSSLSGLLIAVVPIIGVGVARLAGDRDPMTAARWAGLGIGLGGVTLLLLPAVAGGGTVPVLEALGTAVCYAIGPAIAAQKLAGADDLSVTAASLVLASVVYAVPAALTWPVAVPAPRVVGALAGLAAICTALAFLLYLRLIAEAGPVRAEVVTYVNPAVAVALGVLVLGEPFTPLIAISFALILAGSVLATRPSQPVPVPAQAENAPGIGGPRLLRAQLPPVPISGPGFHAITSLPRPHSRAEPGPLRRPAT
jgi:drug/metabolite transporter (DMT)-like permease